MAELTIQAQLNTKLNKKINRLDFYGWLKYAYSLTIIIGVVVLFWFMYFINQNVYQTMVQADLVNNLKMKVASQELQLDDFNATLAKITKKSTYTAGPGAVGNPFNYGVRPAAFVLPVTNTTTSVMPAQVSSTTKIATTTATTSPTTKSSTTKVKK